MSETPKSESRRNATRPPAVRGDDSGRGTSRRKKSPRQILTPRQPAPPPPPEDPEARNRRHRTNLIVFSGVSALFLAGSIIVPATSLASSTSEFFAPTEISCAPRVADYEDTARYVNSLVADNPEDTTHSDNAVFLTPEELDLAALPDSPATETLRQVAEITSVTDEDLAPGDVDFRGLLDQEGARASHERLTTNVIATLNGDHDELLATPPCRGKEDFRGLEIALGKLISLRDAIEADIRRLDARKRFTEQTQWCTGNSAFRADLRRRAEEATSNASRTEQVIADTLDSNESVTVSRQDMAILNTTPVSLSSTTENITRTLGSVTGDNKVPCSDYDALAAERDRLNTVDTQLAALTTEVNDMVAQVTGVADRITEERQKAQEKRQREAEAREQAEQRRAEEAAQAEEARRQREREAAEAQERARKEAAAALVESARPQITATTTIVPEPGDPSPPARRGEDGRITLTTTVSPEEWERMQQ